MKEAAVGVVDRHSLDGGTSCCPAALHNNTSSQGNCCWLGFFDLYIQSQHFLLSRLQWRPDGPVTCIELQLLLCGTVFLCIYNASSQGCIDAGNAIDFDVLLQTLFLFLMANMCYCYF